MMFMYASQEVSDYIANLRAFLMDEVGLTEKEAVKAMTAYNLKGKMDTNHESQLKVGFPDVVEEMVREGIIEAFV